MDAPLFDRHILLMSLVIIMYIPVYTFVSTVNDDFHGLFETFTCGRNDLGCQGDFQQNIRPFQAFDLSTLSELERADK